MKSRNKYVFIVDGSVTRANKIFNALTSTKSILKVGYALTGADALNSINNNTTPDIVLIDLQLTDMSGIEILKQIKQLSKKTIVIILSDKESDKKTCMKSGADNFYTKNELDLAVAQLIIYSETESVTSPIKN